MVRSFSIYMALMVHAIALTLAIAIAASQSSTDRSDRSENNKLARLSPSLGQAHYFLSHLFSR
ncbi:MAG TPA: hypothetical protein V6C65_07010 [Allocoleopsis sp.]